MLVTGLGSLPWSTQPVAAATTLAGHFLKEGLQNKQSQNSVKTAKKGRGIRGLHAWNTNGLGPNAADDSVLRRDSGALINASWLDTGVGTREKRARKEQKTLGEFKLVHDGRAVWLKVNKVRCEWEVNRIEREFNSLIGSNLTPHNSLFC